MYTVINNINIIEIKKSKFITLIYNINNIMDVNNILKEVKNTYKGATHYCYGYILDNIKKESDDNEPSGTAGIPILQVLDSNKLNNTLCIVVRYFGGIKLGSAGLIRAYSKSAKECIKEHIIELLEGYNIDIIFNYNNIKEIDYILINDNIISKDFKEYVIYNVNIKKSALDKLNNIKDIKIIINKKIYIH